MENLPNVSISDLRSFDLLFVTQTTQSWILIRWFCRHRKEHGHTWCRMSSPLYTPIQLYKIQAQTVIRFVIRCRMSNRWKCTAQRFSWTTRTSDSSCRTGWKTSPSSVTSRRCATAMVDSDCCPLLTSTSITRWTLSGARDVSSSIPHSMWRWGNHCSTSTSIILVS